MNIDSGAKVLPILIIVLAMVVTYGAGAASKKVADGDEKKVLKFKIIFKSIGLVLAIIALLMIRFL